MIFGGDYLRKLNPDLCIDIVKEYMQHSPSLDSFTSRDGVELTGESNIPCVKLLEIVTEACPGQSEVLLLMGKLKMQIGDLNGLFNSIAYSSTQGISN